MYPKEFIDEKYLSPIKIDKNRVEFKNLSEISNELFDDLVNLYMSIYNSDNKRLIKEYGFLGTTEKEGIWLEEPWDIKSTTDLLYSFKNDSNTIAIYASAESTKNENVVIGLSAYKHTNIEDFKNRGYNNPFPEIDIKKIPLYYVMETFKRKISNKKGDPIRYFSLELKRAVNLEICKSNKEALVFSSTNNKYMKNMFNKEGRTIVDVPDNVWGKYQGYLYLQCSE